MQQSNWPLLGRTDTDVKHVQLHGLQTVKGRCLCSHLQSTQDVWQCYVCIYCLSHTVSEEASLCVPPSTYLTSAMVVCLQTVIASNKQSV